MELTGWAELGWQAWLTLGVIGLVFAALMATEAATDVVLTGGADSLSNQPVTFSDEFVRVMMEAQAARDPASRLKALARLRPRDRDIVSKRLDDRRDRHVDAVQAWRALGGEILQGRHREQHSRRAAASCSRVGRHTAAYQSSPMTTAPIPPR